MLARNNSRPRHFLSFAAYFVCALPLAAQSVDTADSTAPAPPPATAPSAPAVAAPALPQNSAVTVVSAPGLSPNELSALSPGAGPVPSSGPGTVLTPVLGDHLGSAYTSDRLPFRVTASLAEIYANNIFASPHKTDDYITRLSVQGELQLGNLLSVDGNYLDALYSPSLHLYVRHGHENGVDQDVDVLYAHHFSRLTLSLEQIYTSIQSTDAAVGGLVTTDVFTTLATAKFTYSMKLDLIATFKQQFTTYDVPGYTDSELWVGEVYALYHLDDKLSVGFGPRIGYLILDKGADEHFQQFLARAIYVPSDKLTMQAAAGGEDREYQSYHRSDTLTPIFEFQGDYLPFPSTHITLNATRHLTPSYNFIGQDYAATNVNVKATQRFFRDYYAGLTAGYENDDYKYVATNATGPIRNDNFFYIQPTLSWKPNAALAVAVFDKYEEDDSNFDIFSYDANQVGISLTGIY